MQYLRTLYVNMIGGPSIGKSICASNVHSILGQQGLSVELVGEYAKVLTWKQDFRTRANQIYVTATQFDMLLMLQGQVQVVVTDSPVITGIAFPGVCCTPTWEQHVSEMHNCFENLNVLFARDPSFYDPKGRTQNLEECVAADIALRKYVQKWEMPYIEVMAGNSAALAIVEAVLKRLDAMKTPGSA